jgi:hypothetical protein
MKKLDSKIRTDSGFMALLSAIIISAVLLLSMVQIGSASFFTRSNILDYELKEKSLALAEGCMEVARLRLTIDPGYGGHETLGIGDSTCQVGAVATAAGKITVNVKADDDHHVTELEIVFNRADMAIISYEER